MYWPVINTSGYMQYLQLGYYASKLIDNGIIELVGPRGLYRLFSVGSKH